MKVNGNGSISPLESKSRYKCRKWRLYVSTECGVKTRVVHGTWTNAQSALAAFIGELCDKIPNSETFQAYAASWLLWREKSGDFAPGTLANDRRDLAALNRSALAGMALEDITPQTCRDCLLWIKTHPVRKQGELSNTTMNSIHTTLAAILRQAVDDKRLQASPMEHIKPPKPDTKERSWLEPAQLMQFVHSLESLPLDGRVMALYFMALCGLRRGEACALSPHDIDNGVLCVHLAIKERNGKIGAPKSKAAVRFLPLPGMLLDKVDEWNATRALRGFTSAQTLCCNTRGGVLRPQLLQRWWTKTAAPLLGCSGMTLHQLRHSNLSMMARHLSPFDLQRWAGWSSIEPARIYIHVDTSQLERAVGQAFGAPLTRGSHDSKTGQQPKPLTCDYFWSDGQDLNLRPDSN